MFPNSWSNQFSGSNNSKVQLLKHQKEKGYTLVTRIFPARIIFFETSGARIIWNFEMREFNRGRELFLIFFGSCANYSKPGDARINWNYVRELFEFDSIVDTDLGRLISARGRRVRQTLLWKGWRVQRGSRHPWPCRCWRRQPSACPRRSRHLPQSSSTPTLDLGYILAQWLTFFLQL